MDITRTFKPQALPAQELVEVLATLLREKDDSASDTVPLAPIPSAAPAPSDFPTCFKAPPE